MAKGKQACSPRGIAYDVLMEVSRGGYASDLLLERARALDARDAALAQELVLGVLRYQSQIDFLLEYFAGRRLRLDPEVRLALRLGLYQLRYLDRIPAHAAVGESVELARRARKASAAALVNAVLRKVDRRPVRYPDLATDLAHPAWLLDRWQRQFGVEATRALAEANLKAPQSYLRVRPGQAPPPGAEATEIPGCFRGRAEGYPAMDIGSQSIVPLLDLQPGQLFLDLCAAPGNKTAQALEASVRGVACDRHHHRLIQLRRLEVPLVQLDATAGLPFARVFDRVLVDAPCSGTGTLARNPEIKWKLSAEDLADLQQRQKAILGNAMAVVRPGGKLVYSTCSLESEENEAVVAGYRVERTHRRLPGRERGDGFFAAVIHSN